MRYERLDVYVSVLRFAPTQSDSGEVLDAWTVLLDRCPATRREVRGEERAALSQRVSSQAVEFWLRWHTTAATITPRDRIVYPALADDDVPDVIYDSEQYEIVDVVEVDRRRYIKITALRRPDLNPPALPPYVPSNPDDAWMLDYSTADNSGYIGQVT